MAMVGGPKKNGLSRIQGHRQGAQTAIDVIKHCGKRGIRYLTLYAFSSENWNRPQEEVLGLMGILQNYLIEQSDSLIENEVALSTIGATHLLPQGVQDVLEQVRKKTEKFDRLHLNLALSYGAKDELRRALQSIASRVQEGHLSVKEITEQTIEAHLDTNGFPEPDLFIRTSGEKRLSNFLLWQLSYSELYFTEKLWPEFSSEQFDKAILEYGSRQRRYGLTSEQLEDSGTMTVSG